MRNQLPNQATSSASYGIPENARSVKTEAWTLKEHAVPIAEPQTLDDTMKHGLRRSAPTKDEFIQDAVANTAALIAPIPLTPVTSEAARIAGGTGNLVDGAVLPRVEAIPEGMCPEGCGHPVARHYGGSGCLVRSPEGTGEFCSCTFDPAPEKGAALSAVQPPAPEPVPVPADAKPIGDDEPAF